jgi:hypothetical protein
MTRFWFTPCQGQLLNVPKHLPFGGTCFRHFVKGRLKRSWFTYIHIIQDQPKGPIADSRCGSVWSSYSFLNIFTDTYPVLKSTKIEFLVFQSIGSASMQARACYSSWSTLLNFGVISSKTAQESTQSLPWHGTILWTQTCPLIAVLLG